MSCQLLADNLPKTKYARNAQDADPLARQKWTDIDAEDKFRAYKLVLEDKESSLEDAVAKRLGPKQGRYNVRGRATLATLALGP